MATINQTLCPTLIECGVSVTKIENKLNKGRKHLKWHSGETINPDEMKIAALAILDILCLEVEDNYLPSSKQIAVKIGYPEIVVDKLKREILETFVDYHEQLKAEE